MNIYLQGMRDRSMGSGTEVAREVKLTDWSMAGNLSNRSSGVQIPRDICTRLERYLYSAKCSWIIRSFLIHILGLRAMVNTLLRSLKLLSDVLVLFLFFLAVMALIGLQLFVGELRNKCVRDMPLNLSIDFNDYLQNESKQRDVGLTQQLFSAGRIILLSFQIPYH